jgi:hypothetical protein
VRQPFCTVRREREKQLRLDQFKLQDDRAATRVGQKVHARVQQPEWPAGHGRERVTRRQYLA